MGAEPSDTQFDDLPDFNHVDLTPAWDDADPALLDDALLEPDDAGFEPLDEFGAAEAFGEGFDFAG